MQTFQWALDTADNRVIIGYRHPAVLAVYDSKTGKEVSRNNMISDIDDVFYEETTKLIYASGGGGSINIFKKDVGNSYKKVVDIPTRSGARTSFLILLCACLF